MEIAVAKGLHHETLGVVGTGRVANLGHQATQRVAHGGRGEDGLQVGKGAVVLPGEKPRAEPLEVCHGTAVGMQPEATPKTDITKPPAPRATAGYRARRTYEDSGMVERDNIVVQSHVPAWPG